LPRLLLPSVHDDVGILGIELDQPRPPPGPLSGDQRRAGPAERIEHDVATFRRVANGALNQRDWFHRWVQIILCWLVEEPDITLVAGAAPVVIGALFPTVVSVVRDIETMSGAN